MNKLNRVLVVVFVLVSISCGSKLTFEEQITQDVYSKISEGYCEGKNIPKDAEIIDLKIGDITPIGDTGMIDVSLEFDIALAEGKKEHMKKSMLYLKEKNGDRKMLAIFCDYDYREEK
ncbi:hypothetical protein [Fulvivirga ligni]|uniref:hypothetical protein n=1 Tax=Fulvivirga ligni TaxID=2904246 RepID=UPI001F369D3E|nr:hypothetical protein [Fulvivirga ligni]UII19640.1 hypothetical protein LVD16_17510 [Fulvivirga ligni]